MDDETLSPKLSSSPEWTWSTELLRVTSILHYFSAGVLVLVALAMTAGLVNLLQSSALIDSLPGANASASPVYATFESILWLIFALIALAVLTAVLLTVSGYSIARRENRTISLIASALLLIFLPLGTLVALFSLWVLQSPARSLYA